jgi:hypothetical protein
MSFIKKNHNMEPIVKYSCINFREMKILRNWMERNVWMAVLWNVFQTNGSAAVFAFLNLNSAELIVIQVKSLQLL